uniref:Uncharacterized protein n=1 Tax=Iridovirus LCIVAC01 TaxID=2506607 RepID=A0A481YQ98_9VIRU|nr:MAG: hypothetical protein LCIVAC01_00280 [Iridovirus LCIVAC01]
MFEKEMGVFVELKDAQAYMKQIGITYSHIVARELVFGRVNSEMSDAAKKIIYAPLDPCGKRGRSYCCDCQLPIHEERANIDRALLSADAF